MPRNQNALAIINAAFVLKFHYLTDVIQEARIVYGNIAPDFVHAYATEHYLIGKPMNDNVLQGALKTLSKEIAPIDNPPEESPETRKKLAIGLFYKVSIYNTSSLIWFFCLVYLNVVLIL